ncbi:hypothetical protein V1477_002750, partial [Vespula maculifrons]
IYILLRPLIVRRVQILLGILVPAKLGLGLEISWESTWKKSGRNRHFLGREKGEFYGNHSEEIASGVGLTSRLNPLSCGLWTKVPKRTDANTRKKGLSIHDPTKLYVKPAGSMVKQQEE